MVAKTYLDNVCSVLDQMLIGMSDSHKHTAPQVEINPVANQVILITPTSIMDLTKESPMTDTSPHKEYCLMEKCNNSIRMSLRLKFEDADPMERIIGKKYMSNFTNHADDYCILRRRALEVCHNRDVLIYRNSSVPFSHSYTTLKHI